MASSSFLLESPASIFSSSSIKAPLYLPKPYPFIVNVKRRRPERKRNPVLKSAVGDASVVDSSPPPPPPPQDAKYELISSLKLKLLGIVSGLNRGLAANQDDLGKADDAAKELETVAGPVDLLTDLDKLQGRWKLIYSSAFSSRYARREPSWTSHWKVAPVTLGQVFQRIDVISKDFDNIAEIELGAPWPLPPLEVTATLAHKFEIIGSSKIKITFEKTSVKTRGTFSQLPSFDVPRIPDALRPPSNPGSATLMLPSSTPIPESPEEIEVSLGFLSSHKLVSTSNIKARMHSHYFIYCLYVYILSGVIRNFFVELIF